MDAELARKLFDYNPETGELLWRISPPRKPSFKGQEAGCFRYQDGYLSIGVSGKVYLAHRIIWLIVYGEWPENQIDHINGCGKDNRLANLRDVSAQINSRNSKLYKNNTSRVPGVS